MVRQAQSILEYIIVLSAIIVAVIAAARGPVTNAVNKMFDDSTQLIEERTSSFVTNAGTSAAMRNSQ